MTKAAKHHMGRVADLGCAICHQMGYPGTPAEVHHIREGQGMAQRASDFLTIGLCPNHHRGTHGVHGDKQALRAIKCTELDLLAWTIEQLSRG